MNPVSGFMRYSDLVQAFRPHQGNISYPIRGFYRIETAIPGDRNMDYWFRDVGNPVFVMVGVEGAIKSVNYALTFPAYAKTLELGKMTELYGHKGYSALKNYTYKDIAKNLGVMEPLRERLLTASKNKSYHLIPKMLEDYDFKKLSQAQKEEAKPLLEHLYRRFNYDQYVERYLLNDQQVTSKEAEVLKSINKILGVGDSFSETAKSLKLKTVPKDTGHLMQKVIANLSDIQTAQADGVITQQQSEQIEHGLKSLKDWTEHVSAKKSDKDIKMAKELSETLKKLMSADSKIVPQQSRQKLLNYAKDILKSHHVMNQFVRINKVSYWPQMVNNMLFSLFFTGMLWSALDFKVVQPWQKHLGEKGYSSKLIMKPAYLSFLPATGVFLAAQKSKALKKLGYLGHFTATWGGAALTYTLSTLGWTMARIKNTTPVPPQKPQVIQPKLPEGVHEVALKRPDSFSRFNLKPL